MKGKLLVVGQFILLLAIVFAPSVDKPVLIFRFISIPILLTSIWLLRKAFRDLGATLTPLPESKEGASLVTVGIYRQIRHPIYSALMLLSLAFLMWKQSLNSLILMVALHGWLYVKSKYEDSLLLAKFPGAREYQREVPGFIPRRPRS